MATDLPSPWRIAGEHQSFPRGAFADLLTYEGSLTAELTRLGSGDFDLHLTGQAAFYEDDEDALLIHEGGDRWLPALCREVMMYVGSQPVVAARTLVPEATALAQGWLGELGGRSLGHALFERDDVTRSPFEFAACSPGGDVVQRALSLSPQAFDERDADIYWARRSRFQVGEYPLLVMELFLPGAEALATQAQRSLGAAR